MKVFFWLALTAVAAAQQLDLALPTRNCALLEGQPADFYQFVDRDFQGQKSTPWEGGQFGFVRNPVQTTKGIVFEQFHEGIDIKPLQRDPSGYPLDAVSAIAQGTVVHVSANPRNSNYGNYVVVRHRWGECDYYSLYAHLNRIEVQIGSHVDKGTLLGQLGFTGTGIDQRRAHLHLEIDLLLNPNFEEWHQTHFPTENNKHGLYNGLNLAGLDVARLFLALQETPTISIPEFMAQEEPAFEVIVPGPKPPPILHSYPWLGPAERNAPSWAIVFNNSGLPLKISAATVSPTGPQLRWVKLSDVAYKMTTRGLVEGRGKEFGLSKWGLNYMHLLAPDRR